MDYPIKTMAGNSIKVVAFDCDGVLFDTIDANTAYYNHILNCMGKPPINDAQFEYVHMHTADASLAYLFPDSDELDAAQDVRKNMSYTPFIRKMKLDAGLARFIEAIRPPCKTAVATNRSDTMEKVMDTFNLHPLFDLVVTALDVDHPKPAPDMLLKVRDHFKAASSEIIYIGDSELDARAAAAAGIPFAAFKNSGLPADWHIQEFSDMEVIMNINKSIKNQ